jgi:putative multiple sugar transport system substrate-binding protein
MSKKLKSLVMVLVFTLVTSILAACGAEKVEIGIVLPTKDETRWVQDEERFLAAIKDSKYKTEVLFSQGSSAKELENVEALINKGIKVLIICPFDGDAAGAAVAAAKKAGVTVISYDRLITKTDAVDYYVTFDSFSVGAAQAQYLVDNASGQAGQPLYLYAGAATDNNAFIFFEGSWSVLQPKIADGTFVIANSSEAEALKDKAKLERDEMSKIIGQVTTSWEPNEAKNKAQTHLTASSLKGDVLVLAPNDGTSRALSDVFASDSAITSYITSGQDADKASIQYIIDGKQSMTVLKDVRILVKDSIDMAVNILEGKTVSTTGEYDNGKIMVKAKQTDVTTVDKSNVQDTIIKSEYYPASDFTGL